MRLGKWLCGPGESWYMCYMYTQHALEPTRAAGALDKVLSSQIEIADSVLIQRIGMPLAHVFNM